MDRHVGTHQLNVTVADSEDGRTSFVVDFTVDPTAKPVWQSKTDMTDTGYEAYLLSILGEDGLEELYA